MKPDVNLSRRIVTSLAAWMAAFAIVTLVLVVGGDTLAGAPLVVRTLVMSGILAVSMVNLLMPAIGGLVARLFAGAVPLSDLVARRTGAALLTQMAAASSVNAAATRSPREASSPSS